MKIGKILGVTSLVIGLTLNSACDKPQKEKFGMHWVWGDDYELVWRTYDTKGREIELRKCLVTLDKNTLIDEEGINIGSSRYLSSRDFKNLESYKDGASTIVRNNYVGSSEILAEQNISRLKNGGYYSQERLIFGPEEKAIEAIIDRNGDGNTDWTEKYIWEGDNVERVSFDLNADGIIDTTVTEEDSWRIKRKLTDEAAGK